MGIVSCSLLQNTILQGTQFYINTISLKEDLTLKVNSTRTIVIFFSYSGNRLLTPTLLTDVICPEKRMCYSQRASSLLQLPKGFLEMDFDSILIF